jgi:cytochrome c peroxidase
MGDYPGHFNPKHPRIKVLMSLRSRQNIGRRIRYASIAALLLSGATGLAVAHSSNDSVPIFQEFSDPAGRFANLNTAGPTEMASNAFFRDLGTNGRRCVTCHQPSDAWSVTPPHIRERFNATHGTDPIFRPNDGSGCPTQDVSTEEERREAYRLLLRKGLIRIELAVPANAEFTVTDADNPYGCTNTQAISMYRRPLPSTNLTFLSTVMSDGRETFKDSSGNFEPLTFDLAHQAVDATTGHAQGKVPGDEQVEQIVEFETKLFTAQIRDREAGELDEDGAKGGPANLSNQQFFLGINDPLGGNPTGAPFSSKIFDIFRKWEKIDDREYDENTAARRSIARGEKLFDTLNITITGVAGLNDALCKPDPLHSITCEVLCQSDPVACGQPIHGFCGTCHDSPNVGDHSVSAPLNIGLADLSRRTPDLPLITLKNNKTGEILQMSDPGRALITGKWVDIGKFKGPILRGLAGRAPYFHNGSAATLLDVVNFYDTRFNLNLSEEDKDDLVAFLNSL